MNKNILKTGVQEFIQKYLDTDIVSVLLKKPLFEGVSQQELAEQLEAKKKCQKKLPTWYATPKIYYPNKLHIEQTSSEETARYKADLITGKSVLDMTGGLGVDSYYFSKKIDTVFHCEYNQNLAEITAHNFNKIGAENIKCFPSDGLKFLQECNQNFDWIYIDPSRRNDAKGKVFLLQDCLPNVPQHLTQIFKKTAHILIKTAPLLDITQGLSELKFVKVVHVVAVKNEVKEILWILEKGYTGEVMICTVNLKSSEQETFEFPLLKEKSMHSEFALPSTYLYEPNAAILKSGGFKSVGNAYNLQKLHTHSHLYSSDALIDFPGRTFKVITVVPYNKKEIAQLGLNKANITVRNFPESVASLRKKFKIKEGGDDYLFFTTDVNGQRITIHCKKSPNEVERAY